jgi:purine nucleoside permease
MPKVMNAALTISSLTSSIVFVFDLSKTYFVLSGITGVNPKIAIISTVAFAKFTV